MQLDFGEPLRTISCKRTCGCSHIGVTQTVKEQLCPASNLGTNAGLRLRGSLPEGNSCAARMQSTKMLGTNMAGMKKISGKNASLLNPPPKCKIPIGGTINPPLPVKRHGAAPVAPGSKNSGNFQFKVTQLWPMNLRVLVQKILVTGENFKNG